MKLTEDQIKQGLLHPSKDVRFACLHYFAQCYSPDTTVMPVVIEAQERFGRAEAFRFSFPISDIAQTSKTIQWVIAELQNQSRKNEDQRNYLFNLSKLLCNADPILVQPHEKEIVTLAGFSRKLGNPFSHRLKLLSWDGDALWRELEAICEEGKDKTYAGDMRYNEGQRIVEALGRQGEQHADRMMSMLKVKIEDYDNNPMTWMEPLMVQLAGELRHESAIPLVVAKLHDDAEAVSEACQTALVKFGTDQVVTTIREHYSSAEGHFRLYASGILGRIHTDLAISTGIELLEEEEDLDLENWLALSLVEHFSYEANEAARKVLLSDPDLFDLQQKLLCACTLMEQNFPELGQWRQEVEERYRKKPFLYGPVSPPPAASTPRPAPPALPRFAPVKVVKKAGRNDPCPCGSGKKFKVCCMRK